MKKEETGLQIDLPQELALGHYANIAVSNFSQEEFILDFAMLQPMSNQARVHSRVVMSPRNLKRTVRLLLAQIKEYEQKFGVIEDTDTAAMKLNFN